MAHFKKISKPASRGPRKGEDRWRVGWRNSEGRQLGKTVYGEFAGDKFVLDFKMGLINPETGEYKDEEAKATQQKIVEGIVQTRAERTFDNLAAKFIRYKSERRITPEGCVHPTIEDYQIMLKRYILPSLGGLLLVDIDPECIEEMVRAIRGSGVSNRTINKCLTLTRSIFKHGVRQVRWVADNPVTVEPLPHVPKEGKVMQPEQMWRVVRAIQPPFDVAILILMFTGCRRGECVALQWRDIDFVASTIHFERSYRSQRFGIQQTKTRKKLDVPIGAHLKKVLRRFAASVGEVDPGDWLFPSSEKLYPIGGGVLLNRFKKAQQKVGLSGYTLHHFRHTACTIMGESGADVASIQAVSGHKTKGVLLDTYMHSQNEGARNAASQLEASILAAPNAARNAARKPIEQFPLREKNQQLG